MMEGEMQLLFVCHLVGPFLQRFHIERTRCMMEVGGWLVGGLGHFGMVRYAFRRLIQLTRNFRYSLFFH